MAVNRCVLSFMFCLIYLLVIHLICFHYKNITTFFMVRFVILVIIVTHLGVDKIHVYVRMKE